MIWHCCDVPVKILEEIIKLGVAIGGNVSSWPVVEGQWLIVYVWNTGVYHYRYMPTMPYYICLYIRTQRLISY
jgi:hypothetical protein